MFIKEDNNKIINLLNHLFFIYQRFLKRKKLDYLFKYRINVINNRKIKCQSFSFKLNKENIYNKLYRQTHIKELKLKELTRTINEDESLKYPFTPKINKIISIFYNKRNDNLNQNEKTKININNQEKKFNNIGFHNRSYSISYNQNYNKYNTNEYIPLTQRIKNDNSLINIREKFLFRENNKKYEIKKKENKIPKLKHKKINSHSNSTTSIKLNNESTLNNNNYKNSDFQNNISTLFNARLHKDSQNKKFKTSNNSTSNLYDKKTNYISEKSKTEQISNIENYNNNNNNNNNNKNNNNNNNNNNNILQKKDYFYTLRTGKNPFGNFYNLNYYPPQSNSSKSTHFISPRNDFLNNKIILKGNRLIPSSNYSNDFSYESLKKFSTQNSRGKNSLIIEQFSGTSTGKNNNNNNHYNNNNNNNININNNNLNNINNQEMNIKQFNQPLEISNYVVNEFFENNNNNMNNNIIPITTLQTISDSKLYDLANRYITTDESLEQFKYLNGKVPKKFIKKDNFIHFKNNNA